MTFARRRPFLVGGAAFLWLLLALSWQAPAALVARPLAAACADRCRVVDVGGSFWAGQADLFVRGAADAAWHGLGRLGWRFRTNGLALTLEGGRLVVSFGLDGVRVEATDVRLPAESLLNGARGLPRSRWSGAMLVDTLQFERPWVGAASPRGQARVRWVAAASDLFPGVMLGNYTMQGNYADGAGAVTLTTDGGALSLNGLADSMEGRWRVRIDAQPADPAARSRIEPVLRNLMQTIDAAAGHYRVEFAPAR